MIKIKNISMLRTVDGCLEFIKRYDPETVVTSFYIRQLIRQGTISAKYSGTKIYVNLLQLLKYLDFEIEQEEFPSVEETLKDIDKN